VFNIMDYIGDEYEDEGVYIFMDSNKDPIMFIKKDILNIQTEVVDNYRLARDMGCDFLCVIFPLSLEKGKTVFDDIESDLVDDKKLLNVQPDISIIDTDGHVMLVIIPLKEDSISLTLLKNKSIIYHKTLISNLPIKIGDSDE